MDNGFNNGQNSGGGYEFTPQEQPRHDNGGFSGGFNGGYDNRGYSGGNFNGGYNNGYHNGYSNGYNNMDNQPMSVGQWLLTLIIMLIPCVNIIMCCIWGFGSGGNVNRRNFCRAQLVIIAVTLVLSVLAGAAVGAAASELMNYFYYMW